MPRRIKDWLKDVVADPQYRKHIWWDDEKRQLIAIHWKHASYEDFDDKDSAIFKKWAQDNNRYDPHAADLRSERKRWKTNFRCALHSATNIKQRPGKYHTTYERQSYRVYELLERPDPHKVDQKKRSNMLAAKSKQKPNAEKRVYNSRLNKSLGPLKAESMETRQKTVRREVRKEECSYADVKPDMFMESDSEQYQVMPTVVQMDPWENQEQPLKVEPGDLPATLDVFNDDDREDGGYYSANDSSSVTSMDSMATQKQIPQSTGNAIQSFYRVGPLPENTYNESTDYCLPLLDLNNNVLHTANGNAQECYPQFCRVQAVSCTANARTEAYTDGDVYMHYPLSTADESEYAFTSL